MLDIKRIKDDIEGFKRGMDKRGKQVDVDALLALDERRRSLLQQTEAKKSEQNAVSKDIPRIKKEGGDTAAIFARMKALSDEIKRDDELIRETEEQLQNALYDIPNIPCELVPDGPDSDSNVELRRWGDQPAFDFEPQAHWDIGAGLGILDSERAAKVTGARFHFYIGLGARLERSIINFYLDTHTARGYTEVYPPHMVNRASMTGTGQLPKFEEDAFKVTAYDYFLVPTAEVPVTNLHRDEILNGDDLPIKYTSFSTNFRSEVGSAGRDTRGLIRQHQFNKVELVKFAHPDRSYEDLESLTADAEYVLQALGLPYRVVRLCAGDLGFCSAMTYDIEVYMPSYGRYVEISSCSNFEDFQARRAGIRFRDAAGDKPRLVHTLNGSGVAVGRTVAAILENFQQADGSVRIPEKLAPYMGCEVIR